MTGPQRAHGKNTAGLCPVSGNIQCLGTYRCCHGTTGVPGGPKTQCKARQPTCLSGGSSGRQLAMEQVCRAVTNTPGSRELNTHIAAGHVGLHLFCTHAQAARDKNPGLAAAARCQAQESPTLTAGGAKKVAPLRLALLGN